VADWLTGIGLVLGFVGALLLSFSTSRDIH
jgi:hypothetical protein